MLGFDDAIAEGIKVINKFIPDKNQAAQAEIEYRSALLNADTKLAEAQIEVNQVEAANTNVFVSGWRPFIGWTCGFALFYHYITLPFLMFICAMLKYDIVLPKFDMDSLLTLLFGLLGLGAMRTYEKVKLR